MQAESNIWELDLRFYVRCWKKNECFPNFYNFFSNRYIPYLKMVFRDTILKGSFFLNIKREN